MKKVLLIPIILVLFACNSNTLSVNNPLTYDIKIKNNDEFILVREGTDINEFSKSLYDYLDIKTNADSYTIDWLGESLSTGDVETFETIDGLEVCGVSGFEEAIDYEHYDEKFVIYNFKEDLIVSKESTLNYDSFRPIKVYVDFKKGDETKRVYKMIYLAVAKEREYNIIKENNITSIEKAMREINKHDVEEGFKNIDYYDTFDRFREDGYISNIRQSY